MAKILLRRLERIQRQILLNGERPAKIRLSQKLHGDAVVNPFSGSIRFAADLSGASDAVLAHVLAHELGHREDLVYRALCWLLPMYMLFAVYQAALFKHHPISLIAAGAVLAAVFVRFVFAHRESRAARNAVRRLKLVGSPVDYWQAEAEYQALYGGSKS